MAVTGGSPPAGAQQLRAALFAIGEVVRPGEPILNVVPTDAELMVIARLEPIHIDQVRAGQAAVLRFSALSASTTPEFEGRVRRVSAATVHDESTGLSWYEVELEMGRAVEPQEELPIVAWAMSVHDVVADSG